MNSLEPLYSDKLVDLYFDRLVLKNYYFPFGRSKVIQLIDIASFEVFPCTIMSGKYRIWGSGNFRTWFPLDTQRPKRDKIFMIVPYHQRTQCAFTVENSKVFEQLLRDKKIIQ